MAVVEITWNTVADRTASSKMTPNDDGRPFYSDTNNKPDTSFSINIKESAYTQLKRLCTINFRRLVYGSYSMDAGSYSMWTKFVCYATDINSSYGTSNTVFTLSGNLYSGAKTTFISGIKTYTLADISTDKNNPTVIVNSQTSNISINSDSTYTSYAVFDRITAGYLSDNTYVTNRNIANYTINCIRARYHFFYYNTDGSTELFSEALAHGLTPNPPSFPQSPDGNRQITIKFDNLGGTPTTDTTTNKTVDTFSAAWSPVIPSSATGDFNTKVVFTRNKQPVYVSISSAIPTKVGYIFGGWYTEKNGKGSLVGEAAGGSSAIQFKDDATVYAFWSPTVQQYTIKYKSGNELIVDKDEQSFKQVNIDYDSSMSMDEIDLPTINGFITPNELIVENWPGDLSKIGTKATELMGTIPTGATFIANYTPYSVTAILKKNGGNIGGDTKDITVPYNVLSGTIVTDPSSEYYGKKVISIYSEYKPVKTNSTFVGWVGSDSLYHEVIIPAEETINRQGIVNTYTAEYIDLGIFVFINGDWHPVVNKWVYDGTKWVGENSSKELVHTNTTMYTYINGSWHVERGKDYMPF